MRHYEIVFMIHPDCNDQISGIIEHCMKVISNSKGKVHRIENWGSRQLAYPIKKLHKAYYVLLNIEVSQDTIRELNNVFRFNNIILRNMIMRTKYAITDMSPMMKKKDEIQESRMTIT